MNELLEQIETACDTGHLYLALFCSLTLPDICGAISSPDGLATGPRYKEWFDKFIAPKYDGLFDGSNCYAFRCSTLHQGKAEHRNLGYDRVLFLAPLPGGECVMHKNILNDALNLDLVLFCKDLVNGVRDWVATESHQPDFQKNINTVLRRYPGGLSPYIIGVDVYA